MANLLLRRGPVKENKQCKKMAQSFEIILSSAIPESLVLLHICAVILRLLFFYYYFLT